MSKFFSIFKNLIFWCVTLLVLASVFVFFSYKITHLQWLSLTLTRVLFIICLWSIVFMLLLFIRYLTKDIIEKRKALKALKKEERIQKEIMESSSKGLEKKFYRALKIIKKTTLYERKSNLSRHDLPWYLVMGSANTAKTSIIKNSGLTFPLNNHITKFDDDVIEDSFNSLDFWYGENAIFLDTNGELISQKTPEYEHIWDKMIQLLTKKRSRRPINGIILTIDADSLKIEGDNEKQLEELSITYRLRLEELTNKFCANIPIYLVITKTDQIQGFSEFFSHLEKDKAREVFGFNFDDNIRNITSDMLEEKMNYIISSLNLNVISLMHKEWSPQIRGKILELPQKLSQITVNLKSVIKTTFTENRYHKPLRIRGVYFTSTVDDKTMFLHELLSDLILKERNIINMHKDFKVKYITKQYAFYITCISLVLCISGYFLYYTDNYFKTVDKLKIDFQLYEKNQLKLKNNQKFIPTLYVLNPIYACVSMFNRNDKHHFWEPGFYNIPKISEDLSTIYYYSLKKQLVHKTKTAMESNILHNIDNEYDLWFNTKIYLMTSYKKFRDNNMIQNYMYNYWYDKYPSNKVVRDGLNLHFKNLLNYGLPETPLNTHVYAMSKEILSKTNLSHLIYYKMKERYKSLEVKSFQFSDLFDSDINVFKGDNFKIPALYTKESFNLIFIKGGISVIQSLAKENWVAGYDKDISKVELAKLYMQVMSLYLYDYKNYWQKAISKLEIIRYTNLEDNSLMISQIGSLDSPIVKVIRELKRQTTLLQLTPHKLIKQTNKANIKVLKGLEKHKINPFDLLPENVKNILLDVEAHFAHITSILTDDHKLSHEYLQVSTHLDKLHNEISLINEAAEKNSYALGIVRERALNKHTSIVYINKQLPPVERKWLETATRNTWDILFDMAYNSINNAYRENIYKFYNASFVSKYPLAPHSSHDVSIDDFNEMFRKNGTIDTFVNDYLTPFFKGKKGEYYLKTIDNDKLDISNTMLKNLNLIKKIQKSYFDKNGSMQVSFELSPLRLSNNVRSTKLTYGKTVISYSHGPIYSYKFNWLKSGVADQSASLTLLDDKLAVLNNMKTQGDWAIFKLIQLFSITNSSKNHHVIHTVLSKDIKSKHVKFTLNGNIINLISSASILSNFKLDQNL